MKAINLNKEMKEKFENMDEELVTFVISCMESLIDTATLNGSDDPHYIEKCKAVIDTISILHSKEI